MNKTSGQLRLTPPHTDQLSSLSTTTTLQLVVKASTDCSSGYWELEGGTHRPRHVTSSSAATQDRSLLLVSVALVVMATPRFTVTSLYAAVLPQTQPGHEVISLAVSILICVCLERT